MGRFVAANWANPTLKDLDVWVMSWCNTKKSERSRNPEKSHEPHKSGYISCILKNTVESPPTTSWVSSRFCQGTTLHGPQIALQPLLAPGHRQRWRRAVDVVLAGPSRSQVQTCLMFMSNLCQVNVMVTSCLCHVIIMMYHDVMYRICHNTAKAASLHTGD